MKHIALVLFIGLVLSLCNLSERFKKSGSNSNSAPAISESDAKAELAQPTAAQAAALSGGQEAKWERQGMSWTVPPNWTQTSNDSTMFMWRSPGSGAASLIVNISPMDDSFPPDVSIKQWFEQARGRAKNGQVDEVKWVEIDGVKGVQFREASQEHEDSPRRLQWIAYRTYLGQLQLINLMLASESKDFERHKDAMYGILYSGKIAH